MISDIDKAEMAPSGNTVVSLKLSSSENIVGQFVDHLEEDGILVLKNPLKILQGVNAEGNEYVMMQRYDPSASDSTFAISASHIISLQPTSYTFKKQYITNVLRYSLFDIDAIHENEVLSILTDKMVQLCEDAGVVSDMSLLPFDHKNITRH